MLKVAVFDLDGTLCAVGKSILPDTLELLRQLQDKGVQIALSSGKPIYYLCGVARQAGMEKMIIMGENGASVQVGVDLPPQIHYWMPVAPEVKAHLSAVKEKLVSEFGNRVWMQPSQLEVTPFFPPEDMELHNELRAFMKREVTPDMGITIYDQKDCFDLCPTGIDKGSGLAYLCQQMGWDLADAAAVGDGVNDEPMLRMAGYSIGIGENVAGAKDSAPTIQDAIRKLLEKV